MSKINTILTNSIMSIGLLMILVGLASVLSIFNLALFGFGFALVMCGTIMPSIEFMRKPSKNKNS